MGKRKRDAAIFDELTTPLEEVAATSLLVQVDYLALVERYGDDEAWSRLAALKDMLG